jgi:hypothetical protein
MKGNNFFSKASKIENKFFNLYSLLDLKNNLE